MKNYAIILASGTGSRFGNDIPKQFVDINGRTILEWAISAFEKSDAINEIFVVITPEYRNLAQDIINCNNYKKLTKLLNGGKIRKESSFIGVSAVEENEANILIHDCARAMVSQKIISDCITALEKYDAVCTAINSTDTVLNVENGIIKTIPLRANVMRAQTPQGFKLSVIKKAHELSKNDNNFTDDCGLVVRYNLCDVHVVEGNEENFKITYKDDLDKAKKILQMP